MIQTSGRNFRGTVPNASPREGQFRSPRQRTWRVDRKPSFQRNFQSLSYPGLHEAVAAPVAVGSPSKDGRCSELSYLSSLQIGSPLFVSCRDILGLKVFSCLACDMIDLCVISIILSVAGRYPPYFKNQYSYSRRYSPCSGFRVK